MSLASEMVGFLAGEMGCAVVAEYMPQEPARVAAVFLSDGRYPGDANGARVQVLCRGGFDQAVEDAMDAISALKGFEGRFVPEGNWIAQVALESGPVGMQADENGRLMYSVNFRVWECPYA